MSHSCSSAGISSDPSQQTFHERENFLLSWTSQQCLNNGFDLDSGWNILDTYGIQVIQRFLIGKSLSIEKDQPMGTKGYTSLYTISFRLCTTAGQCGYAKDIYDRCNISVEEFVISNIVSNMGGKIGLELLKAFSAGWTMHKLLTSWMWRLFQQIDKNVLPQERPYTITSCYLNHFYELVFKVFLKPLRVSLLECIADDRKKGVVDREVLKDSIQIFQVMGVVAISPSLYSLPEALKAENLAIYRTEFEGYYLDATKEYYNDLAIVLEPVDDVISFFKYLAETEAEIEAIKERAEAYLHFSTTLKAIKKCLTEMIVFRRPYILLINNLVFIKMRETMKVNNMVLSEDQKTNLKRMHDVYHLTVAQHPENTSYSFLDGCAEYFCEYVIALGDQIIAHRLSQQTKASRPPQASNPSSSSSHATSASPTPSGASVPPNNSCHNNTVKEPEVVSTSNVSTSEGDIDFIENSLNLYEHASFIMKDLFNKNSYFVKAFKDAMDTFVNRDVSTSSSGGKGERSYKGQSYPSREVAERRNKRAKLNSSSIGISKSSDDQDTSEVVGTSSSSSTLPHGGLELGSSSSSRSVSSSPAEEIIHQGLNHESSSTAPPLPIVSQVCMLAAYCDKLLKGGIKQHEHGGDLDTILDRCVSLFSHISDKDLFAELYRNALSRRLLNKKSVSNDSERGFISKLKSQCGGPYTAKLEGMLNDFLLADEMNKEFEPSYVLWKGTQQRQLVPEGLSFDVQVLSSGHWPSQQHREALLPPELEACKVKFNEWYHTIHSHRTLKWMLNLGEGIITAKIGDRTYDIQVTTLQTIILRIFDNTLESLSFTQIQQRAGITEIDVLKRLLHSLSCQKFKILLKSSSGKNVSPSDTFKVNLDFTSPLKKFRIPMAVLEDVEAVKTVQVERGTTTDAAIVRIMKSRKVINHNVLVGELLSQLCFFTPDPKAIKQRIESLIDREYMKRDLNDNKTYHYLP